MKRIAFGLFAALALCAPALADIAVTPGTGTTVNLIDFTGATTPAGTARCASTNHCAATAVIDTAGLPVTGLLGTPSVSAITIQGGPGGTAVPISGSVGLTGNLPGYASTPTFNCGTGCFQTTQPISGNVGITGTPTVMANQGTAGASAWLTTMAAGGLQTGAGVDGWNITEGTKADAACASGGTACSIEARLAHIENTSATTATNSAAPIPTQAPTVSIGGVGIVDSGGTNVASVKAASTSAAATDKSLVVQINPQQTPGINTAQVNGIATLTGAGATGTGSQRFTAAQDSTTIAGSNPGRTYNTIAASQSAQVLSATGGGGTGATGDYLSHCDVIPTATSPGVVTILDNATTIYAFPGGASSLSNLVPFVIPVGAVSVSGAWKITTGANLSVVCTGKFS